MSKSRIKQRVRRNEDYKTITRLLKALGLRHSVYLPTGKGAHPRMVITDGTLTTQLTITCSPSSVNPAAVRRRALNELEAAGFNIDSA